jgi:molybdopterin/thiamine biosynthesis adenylyltransferase
VHFCKESMELNHFTRFARQQKMPGFEAPAQAVLADARVAIVGLGGLGSGVLMALVSAGIQKFTLIDGDKVAIHNLHRQWIYSEENVGMYKVEAAALWAKQHNVQCELEVIADFLNENNIQSLLNLNFDLVMDCTDQIEAKILLDGFLSLTDVPWIFAASEQWDGMVSTFNCPNEEGVRYSYSQFFNDRIKGFMVGSCEQRGALGPVVQAVAMVQSIEALKLLSGQKPIYIGKIWIWEANQGVFLSPPL